MAVPRVVSGVVPTDSGPVIAFACIEPSIEGVPALARICVNDNEAIAAVDEFHDELNAVIASL